jgi:hypothetical protein
MVFNTAGDAIVSSDPWRDGPQLKFRSTQGRDGGRTFMTGITVGAVAGAAGVFIRSPCSQTTAKT